MVELLATGIVHAAAAVPLLQNEGFLQDPVQPAQPRAWRTFQHEGVYEIGVDVSQPGTHDGSSVRIFGVRHDGRNSRAGVGQVTPVQDGTYAVYELHLRYKGDIEQADYLVWVRPPQSFDDLHSFRGVLPTPRDTWTEVTVELRVPEPIRVNGFRFEVLLYGRGDGTVWYDSAQLVPKEGAESGGPPRLLQPSSKLEAQFSPHEGMIVQQNPPSFVWPGDPEATEYELLISPTPEFPPGETLRFADLNLNLHTPETPMGPGTWYWMVRGLRRGVTVSESAVRKFEIDEAATVFTLPSVESLLQRIPAHPRILVDQAVLSQFRSSVNLDLLRRGLRSQLASRIGEPLHPEPTFFGDQNSQDYVDFIVPLVNRPTMDLTARMRQMAHAYLLTGDEVVASAYAGGHMYKYDPGADWNPESYTRANPKLLAQIGGPIARPRKMLAYPDGRHIVMAGFADYGWVGGGIAVYDLEKDEYTLFTADQLLPGHSTITMRVLPDGNLVGGTSVEAPGGGHPTESIAKLFIMDWETKEILFQTEPDPGLTAFGRRIGGSREVVSIEVGPDGLVYGVTNEAVFFVFDPERLEVVHRESISEYGRPLRDTTMFRHGDYVYALLQRRLVQIEPGTFKHRAVSEIDPPATGGVAVLGDRIFFPRGSELWSMRLPDR